MIKDYTQLAKEFILTEGDNPPDVYVYLQSINDCLSALKPATKQEQRRLAIARESARSLRREIRKIKLEIHSLKESGK